MDITQTQVFKKWQHALTRSGYRLTQPRRVILEIIAGSSRPLSPIEIFDQAREITAHIGLVTVYRTVEKLEELKLIDRVHHIGQCQTVFKGSQGHQHLLVCTECGKSAYFKGLQAEDQFAAVGETYGYEITGHTLQLSGLCPDCRKKEKL